MKQLTKEQHEAICEWLVKTAGCTFAKKFANDFEPSCCDSRADGETCKSEIVRGDNESAEDYIERLKYRRAEIENKKDYEQRLKQNLAFYNPKEETACEESIARFESKMKHIKITDLTWDESQEIAKRVKEGSVVLIERLGKTYYIDTNDVKPAEIIAK